MGGQCPSPGIRDTKEGAESTTRLALFWCAYAECFTPKIPGSLQSYPAFTWAAQRLLLRARTRVSTGISFVGPWVRLVINLSEVLKIKVGVDLGG